PWLDRTRSKPILRSKPFFLRNELQGVRHERIDQGRGAGRSVDCLYSVCAELSGPRAQREVYRQVGRLLEARRERRWKHQQGRSEEGSDAFSQVQRTRHG